MERTTTHLTQKQLNTQAAINGVYLGLISVVITLIIFYVSPAIMGSPSFGIISMVVMLAISIYFILEMRKKNGGYWAFREALSAIFIFFFVTLLTSSLIMLGFGKVESTYENTMRDITLNSMTEMSETLFPNNPEAADAMILEAEKSLDKQYNPTIGQFLTSQGLMAIFCFIGALIFALIFKRNRPVFAIDPEEEAQRPTYTE